MAKIEFEKTEEQVLAESKEGKFLKRGIYIWPVVGVTHRYTDKGHFILSIVFDTGFVKEGQPVFESDDYFMLDKNSGLIDPGQPGLGFKEINIKQLNRLRDILLKVFNVPFSKVSSIVDTLEVNKLKGLVQNLNSAVKCDEQYKLVGKEACVTYDWPTVSTHPEGKFYQQIRFINKVDSFDYWSGKFDWMRPNPNPKPAATTAAAPAVNTSAAAAAAAPEAKTSQMGTVTAMFTEEEEDNDLPF